MNFTIETHRTPEEVRMLIQSVTALRDGLSYTSSENKTPGKAKTTPFFPVIVGYMQTRGNGTVVDVKMRLPWGGVYLIVSHFFVFAMGFLVWDWKGPYTMYFFKMAFLSVGGIGLLYWVCVRCWFHFGAKRAREDMEYLLGD